VEDERVTEGASSSDEAELWPWSEEALLIAKTPTRRKARVNDKATR
jgi:hypothetical protein